MKVFLNLTSQTKKLLGLVFLSAALTCSAQPTEATNTESAVENIPHEGQLRVGIARGAWQGFNRNDASAAIAVWAKTILAQKGIPLEVKPTLYESSTELIHDLQTGALDCVNMTIDQFLLLPPDQQPSEIYLASSRGSYSERYLLIVHNESGIRDLQSLHGHKLLVQSGVRSSMALTWLDSVLASESLPKPDEFVTLSEIEKPSKAILPVFFHQADACLVTSNAFEVASELNPQLKTNLRILAASPEIITSCFFFRNGSLPTAVQQLEPAILTLHEATAGLQVLTVFQCDRMLRIPVSYLEPTRQLIAERDRLRQQIAKSINAPQ